MGSRRLNGQFGHTPLYLDISVLKMACPTERDKMDNQLELEDFAEKCAVAHLKVASSENYVICDGVGEIYRSSRRLLFAAIRAAYPNLDTQDIYDVWVDCTESIAYCAEYVRDNPESSVYTTPR